MGARKLAILILPTLAAAALAMGAADGPDTLAQARALEKQMEKIIADAEPSIACILVSRNETYRKLCTSEKPPDDPPALFKSVDYYKRAGKLGQPAQIGTKFFDRAFGFDYFSEDLFKRVNLADPGIVPEAFGSGVVVDAERGLILTNYHVVRDAVVVFVRLPGKKGAFADIHAADSRSDLAVLRVLSEKNGAPPMTRGIAPLPLGDAGKLRRGQFILSLANPYAAGFREGQPSASWGILSNVRRRAPIQLREEERIKSLHHYGTWLELDARLNLGCSGGAVLNLTGELVGLTTAHAAIHGGETPGGFAVPMDANFHRILKVLKDGDELEYGFLGVRPWEKSGYQPRSPNDQGVRISDTTVGAPAYEKLLKDDRILAVGSTRVNDSDDLFLYLGTQLAGSNVKLKVNRPRKNEPGKFDEVLLDVTLAKNYIPGIRVFSTCKNRPFKHGLRVEYTSVLIRNGEAGLPNGVLVDEVMPDSAAGRSKLAPGQVIASVNGQSVANPVEFYRAVEAAKGPLELSITGVDGELVRKVRLR